MPWQERTKMSLKLEFVTLADREEANMSALCRRFDISRPTGYKWLRRYREEGAAGLEERSRRPDRSPNRTPESVVKAVCEIRERHPSWGGRKIRARLRDKVDRDVDRDVNREEEPLPFGPEEVPAASTCQSIVKRNGLVDSDPDRRHAPFERFEKEAPNQLWQMDFKGHFPLVNGTRCHALTIVDDHSRFALALEACPDEQRTTVKKRLEAVFERYGLPRRILCDNSLPWGVPATKQTERPLYTKLNRWLIRLGIDVVHGRPYHPETQGKAERFHRSLTDEVLRQGRYESLSGCQDAFDQWRHTYNLKRPHEALGLQVPASRYQASGRPFPETMPEVSYSGSDPVRQVSTRGQIQFGGEKFYIGNAFGNHPVVLRPAEAEGTDPASRTDRSGTDPDDETVEWTVKFCHKTVRVIEAKPPDSIIR